MQNGRTMCSGRTSYLNWTFIVLLAWSSVTQAAEDLLLLQTRTVKAKAKQTDQSETTVVSAGDSILLKAHTGMYVHAVNESVWARLAEADEQHVFVLEKPVGSSSFIQSGDTVFLRTRSGRHLEVEGTNGSIVTSRFDDHITWSEAQKFVLTRQLGDGEVLEGDNVFLRAHTGLAIVVQNEQLIARAEDDGMQAPAFVLEMASRVPCQTPPSWVVKPIPGEYCDPSLECHRPLNISCQTPDGSQKPFHECNHGKRPWSYEPCFKSPRGACINIAPSDCLDIPGNWWNLQDMTCAELKAQGACKDNDLVQRACRATCGECTPVRSTTPPPSLGTCYDDGNYRSSYFHWHCEKFKDENCTSFAFQDELTKACPKSCGLCS
eukprot:TRINITY_DN17401_c0_g2_i1.p1 TRINITY_DN17401_c0_g2~~TRINITY_DN17401_c0_g2_i1.p1  ORF type:complete len:378 (-),score=38.02 TRINITY_DN17401_c0_g2_i1:120-1253(-)